ncbi:NACHT domain-containing protein [Streptomyces yaanensis]|uniref:NACHT domain-containing protein n=1 Tax=Streptomyces yaanensis TaxID=1142239 RepID=A0ABV7SA97_9ACTN|nr:NACHT domain-containing protein [Streptomyces sp. CGMCC 4.7035]WNB99923.1 NACHT domain-containing protein [Streptomyces sp. CGMCC 4.7035]
MDTQRGEWGGWQSPSEVRNIVQHSTVEYLVQVGYVHGNLVVNLPPTRDPADIAAEELARAVRARWSAEAAAWDLGDTQAPLSVRWLARWTSSADTGAAVRSDRLGDVVDTLCGLDPRRMLVLGGPGSGKSTLLAMTVLRLAERHLGDVTRGVLGDRATPVPVLLSLESWEAETMAFRDWLVGRIEEDHPGLPRVAGEHPARRLVRDGRVLAVLDGLDELPDHRRAAVVRELDAAPRESGFVMASRTEEYRALGLHMAGVSDIEALPVGPRDAARYLLRTAPDALHERWGQVVDELAEHPDGPLARALTTPLMIWLARRAYSGPYADPARLTDRAWLPTREAVEKHLLDEVIPAAFAPRAHDTERLHAPGRWNAVRARGWLAFLARELDRRRTAEFSWWRLNRAWAARLLTVPTLAALCIVLAESVLSVTTWAQDTYGDSVLPASIFEHTDMLAGFAFGMSLQMATMFWFGDRIWEPRRRANPFKAGAALRSASRAASVRRGLTAFAVLLVPSALLALLAQSYSHPGAFAAQALLSFAAPALVMAVIAAPSDTVDAATPDELLRDERRTTLLTLGVVAPMIGLGAGAHALLTGKGPVDVTAASVKALTGAVMVLVVLSEWSLWVVSKAWLALLGRVPWSLMEFLRDAYGQGLLMRYGGTYRFRHLRLQEHLAGRERHATPSPAVPAPRQQPLVVTQPQPRRRPPAAEPLPRFSEMLDNPPAMHELRGYTALSTDQAYVFSGRDRRLPLGHWPWGGLFMVVAMLRLAATGNWDEPAGWVSVAFWPVFALLINIVAYLLPKTTRELRVDAHGIEARMGRHRVAYAWQDVLAAGVRQVYVRGRNQRCFGPHVRLKPGAPTPKPVFRGRDGWYLVLPLHVRPTMPPDVVDAFARFSGGRWQG